jgi:hypothetical protein
LLEAQKPPAYLLDVASLGLQQPSPAPCRQDLRSDRLRPMQNC